MVEIKIDKCPYCGAHEFAEGYHYDEASIMNNNTGIVGSKVIYVICKNCGSIVHSRVANPEVFSKSTSEEKVENKVEEK